MMLLALLAAGPISAELDALDRAVATCTRAVVNPAFAADAGRRSAAMTETVREQEEIAIARLDIADRRRALRETRPSGRAAIEDDQQLAMATLAIEDRQRALNDRRLLDTMRAEAMDVKRRYFLAHCAKGTNNAQN